VTGSNLRIIVTGQMAQYPLGGVTWFYLQYVLGLARLGHDVFYIEDSSQWPYNPMTQALPAKAASITEACQFNLDYLNGVLSRFGLADKWAYCFPKHDTWFGVPQSQRENVIASADLLVNVSGTLGRPENYRQVRRMAYVDTDPVFTQVKLARGEAHFRTLVDRHDVHFSYGEHPSPMVPDTGHRWRPTRAPVVLSEWTTGRPHRNVFTTIMNWTSHNSVTHDGRTFGQKDVEFKAFIDLPTLVRPTEMELAVGPGHGQHTPYDLLRYKGWRVVDPVQVCPDLDSFRAYTEESMAEWGVAKNGYVQGQSGWFSERSARYLAAGRPVVVQDTGFSHVLPVGVGLVPFRNLDEAVAGIRSIEGDYARHAKAAREIADEYFDSDKVLTRLVDEAMNAG
jgi:hypothetical protein